MAQQNIDFGTFPNDPSADPVRAAFQKIQENFNELYTTTFSSGVAKIEVGPGLNVTSNTGNIFMTTNFSNISIQTGNSLLVGVGVANSNAATITNSFSPFVITLANTISTGNANLTGNVRTSNLNVANFVTSSLVPNANATLSLGSSANRWRDLYLSGNAIYLGSQTISSNATTVSFSNVAMTGTLAVTGNTTISNVVISTTANVATLEVTTLANVKSTNTSTSTTTGALRVAGGVGIAGNAHIGGIANVSGNLTTNNLAVTSFVNGNLIPATNEEQDLGSETNRWRDLYLSGNTLNLGGVTISADPTTGGIIVPSITSNSLSVNGVELASDDGSLTTESLLLGGVTITGNSDQSTIIIPQSLTLGNAVRIEPNATDDGVMIPSKLSLGNVDITSNSVTNTVSMPERLSLGGVNLVANTANDSLTVPGTLTFGNVSITSNGASNSFLVPNLSVTSNLVAGNISATFVTGTITSSAQPNITSLGLLSNLAVAGNISTGELSVVGNIAATRLNVGVLSATTIQAPGSNTQILFNDGGNANAITGLTFDKSTTLLSLNGNFSSGNINTTGNLTASNVTVAGGLTTLNVVAATGITSGANLAITSISGTGSGGSPANRVTVEYATQTTTPFLTGQVVTISGVTGTLTYNGQWPVVSSNTTHAVLNSSATGTGVVTSARIIGGGDIATNGSLSVVGNASVGNLGTSGTLVVSGNASAGNITTSGSLSVTGNANVGNISGGAFTATLFTGNGAQITGVNILNTNLSLVTTAATGTGSVATLTFATQAYPPFAPGQTITVTGIIPTEYRVTDAVVISCTTSTVTYSSAATGSQTTAGVITGAARVGSANLADAANIANLANLAAQANIANSANISNFAGTVTTSAQPNITSVGNLTGLTVTGTFTGSNVSTSGFMLASVTTGITAAGTDLASATALTRQINVVSSASAGQGIRLPATATGMQITVINTTGVTVKVYPTNGSAIDSLGTNVGFDLGAGARLTFVATSTSQWYSLLAVYG
jgi:hypothetical protein